jgi:hypothetical protein
MRSIFLLLITCLLSIYVAAQQPAFEYRERAAISFKRPLLYNGNPKSYLAAGLIIMKTEYPQAKKYLNRSRLQKVLGIATNVTTLFAIDHFNRKDDKRGFYISSAVGYTGIIYFVSRSVRFQRKAVQLYNRQL